MMDEIHSVPLGRTPYGRPINLDLWSGTTHNMAVLSKNNASKRATMKHLITQHVGHGVTVIVVDMWGDYKALCNYLKGSYLDSNYLDCPEDILSANFIVVDLSDMLNFSDYIKEYNYNRVLSWCRSRMVQDVKEEVLIVLDDAAWFSIGDIDTSIKSMIIESRIHNAGIVVVGAAPVGKFRGLYTNMTAIAVLGKIPSYMERELDYFAFKEDDLSFLSEHKNGTALLQLENVTHKVVLDIPSENEDLMTEKPRLKKT